MARRVYSAFPYSLGPVPIANGVGASRRRRRWLAVALVLLAGFLLAGVAVAASRAGVAHAPARATGAHAGAQPSVVAVLQVDRSHAYTGTWLRDHPATDAPAISGSSGVVVDLGGRRLLFAKDATQRMAMASLTKLVTAMVALDAAPPDRAIETPAEATRVEPNHMGLSVGERLSLRELLYGLLLDSGNDAAEAIAAGTLGRAAFVEAMNRKAALLDLHDSHFENPSGFDGPGQYSTAYDLSVFAGTMLDAYPELRTVVATRERTLASTAGHKWFGPYNLNRLLWTYPGAIGIKPGYTEGAQYTLAAAATRNGHTVIAVVLGSQRHFTDGAALLDYGFRRVTLP